MRIKNHYVSQGYLKRWSVDEKTVYAYRVLVSNENVPLWTRRSIDGIGYHRHLYTRIVAGKESDELERVFGEEYESPAELAIRKAVSDQKLTPDDWRHMVRFLALQDIRTPARLFQQLDRWGKDLPIWLDKLLLESVGELESIVERGGRLPVSRPTDPTNRFPLRTTIEKAPNSDGGLLKAELTVGRELWLFTVRNALENTANVLHKHKWTVLKPPKGKKWITSDNPVVRLNYYNEGKYDFGGGWDSEGSEILFPLGLNHLLYTRVGHKPPLRGTRFPEYNGNLIRRFIAEHGHRMIFSKEPDDDIPRYKPRIVSADALKNERSDWEKWHKEQTEAELASMET